MSVSRGRGPNQDGAASLFKQEPCAEQLVLDAGGVRPGHVALGQGQDNGAARRLRVRQRLPGLHQKASLSVV